MMPTPASRTAVRLFDLNIDKFLEHWGPAEAVREIIANAIDEQTLTETDDIEVRQERVGVWTVLTQNESAEKRRAAAMKQLLGRFGVGLKDALATLERHGVSYSKHSVNR